MSQKTESITNVSGSRRRHSGMFKPGNPGGPGNPCIARVTHFRQLLLRATSDADMLAVWELLIKKAKGGEPWAIREFLDRVVGKAKPEAEGVEPDGESVRDKLVAFLREGVSA